MEKVNRKKLAKAALLTAALSIGAVTGVSMYNEAQTTGSLQYGYLLYMCYNGYGCRFSAPATCGMWAPCG